jgi:hypothetical protein
VRWPVVDDIDEITVRVVPARAGVQGLIDVRTLRGLETAPPLVEQNPPSGSIVE